jgi:uncharacterized protein
MLFKRRRTQGRWEQLKLWLWPRVSWRRSLSYYTKRILRLSGTPRSIAMGTAAGVAISFTPLLGLHVLLALGIAWLLRGNLVAAGLGTFVGNPLTFPFIWAGTYQLGHMMLHGAPKAAPAGLEHDLLHRSIAEILPLIKPMLVGAVPSGLIAGTIAYLVVYKTVAAYQESRRSRLDRGQEKVVGGLAESRRNS